MTLPRVGISACLLGQKVRHNGEHKFNDWIVDQLGKFVKWVPICPEVEMGLGVPRSTMRLVGKPDQPKLLVHKSDADLTELASHTAHRILATDLDLDAYILKKDSPSCGLERVKVYGKNNIPIKTGVGIYAAVLKEKYPFLPKVEEGRLSDLPQREAFATLIFAWNRFRKLKLEISELQKYHQEHKLLLMSHNAVQTTQLGRIVANPSHKNINELVAEYGHLLLETMDCPSTVKKRFNAIQHAFGYFKTKLDPSEKANVLEVLESYRVSEIPWIAPLTLLRHLARKYSISYLETQIIFQPYPKGLRIGWE